MDIMDSTGVAIGTNEYFSLFQWVRSAISSKWRGTEEQGFQNKLFHLQCTLQHLSDNHPEMYDLINRAEWRSHKHGVAELLPKLKDAAYDVEDLLDELRWYNHKVIVEGNASQLCIVDFFKSFINVNDIHKRLDHISNRLEKRGLGELTPRFDKTVRPETSSFPNEAKIFGRNMELEQILGLLGVPAHTHLKRKREIGANESRLPDLPVLSIVGMGGVGKTTLAQHICTHPQVKSHYDTVIWICVSDDFDEKRLTKEAIESCPGNEARTNNLDSLQHNLSNILANRKFLIVLDDLWDDALKRNGQCWKSFCAPFKNVLQGNMMLVTTRSQKVSDLVCTMEPIILQGLKDDVFWNFFKLCVFGSASSNDFPELALIGRKILPKLKGSPLAAKTLGRMLHDDLRTSHWNNILDSELWELDQETTEIVPALRLSYMYLPFHLKRCFSFCAVYPKDKEFEKGHLAELWAAEGFVKRQGVISVQDIGCQYFNDLLNRSFFQEVEGKYLIHDLLHDMAQKVSEDDCFIVKNKDDFKRIPQNVRHLSVLSSKDINNSNLLSLCKYRKLRTLLCSKSLANKKTPASLIEGWCSELLRMRVMVCTSMNELPASIGKLKHLQYLKISRACSVTSLPATICRLHSLQVLCVKKCKLESLPKDFSMLINLWRFESSGFKYGPNIRRFPEEEFYYGANLDAANEELGLGCRFIQIMKHLRGHLEISNIDKLSKNHSAEAELKNKEYLDKLTLQWCFSKDKFRDKEFINSSVSEEHEIEVLPDLQPPTSVKTLVLDFYPAVSLPRWFQPRNLPSLTSISFLHCGGLEIATVPVDINNDNISFSSLTDLIIDGCNRLSSVENLLNPIYLPVIKKIALMRCPKLVSVPTERFGDFCCLEIFRVLNCERINSPSLTAPSVKKLVLGMDTLGSPTYQSCGNLADKIQCCSLTNFFLSSRSVTSIQLPMWDLPALQELRISNCRSLTSIQQSSQVLAKLSDCKGNGNSRVLSSLTSLTIDYCKELSSIDGLLQEEYLPAIESITVSNCTNLSAMNGERFGRFPSLKNLTVFACNRIKWRGFVLPSSLQRLDLIACGDISPFIPSCLENLKFLVSLKVAGCSCIRSIPRRLWSSTLSSLQELQILNCPDLVSIGGLDDISKLRSVWIYGCQNLKGIEQPVERGSFLIPKKEEKHVKTSPKSVWCP